MKDDRLTLIWKASGYLDSQLIKNFLESYGLDVYSFEESIGIAYGLTNTPLGEVELYVPNDQAEKARFRLNEYFNNIETNSET